MSKSKISVVLPTFNVERYIERCVFSLQKQSFSDFEIVFVDDCGTDSSISIVEKYAKADSRIKIIKHKKNLGTYFARKTGVENATGDYIVFLDPDDEFAPGTINEIVKESKNDPDLILFGSKREPELKFWQTKAEIPSINTDISKAESIHIILKCKNLNRGIAGKAVKRECLLSAYALLNVQEDEKLIYGEDQLLFLAIIHEANIFSSIKNPLYIYHINYGSITSTTNPGSINNNILLLNNIITKIEGLKLCEKETIKLKSSFTNSLRCQEFRLKNRVSTSSIDIVYNYINTIKLSHSFKDIVKFLLYIVTIGKIHKA